MVRVRMPVDYSQYWITADDVLPDEALVSEEAAGLVQWHPGAVIVTAAEQMGSVGIDVELLDTVPAELESAWQDAVEFSLTTSDGDLRLMALMESAKGPNLAHRGPGSYRFRLSAVDRDPVDKRKARERHRLQVWPAPEQPFQVLRFSSKFAADWAAPAPARIEPDWATLATQPGVRLIVDWFKLQSPPDPITTGTVVVETVLPGSPATVFKPYSHTNPGYLGRGMLGGGKNFLLGPFWHRDPEDEPWREHVGDLAEVVSDFEWKRFSHVRFRWGFAESPGSFEGNELRRGTPRVHPIEPGSVALAMEFAKAAGGRRVIVTLDSVPDWLADDVAALWQLIPQVAASEDEPFPWSQYLKAPANHLALDG